MSESKIKAKKSYPTTPCRRQVEEKSSYSFLISVLMRVSGQYHALAALYPQGKDSRCPLDRRLGEPQSWSGHRG
jgi:hypothetical protein